MSQKGCTDSDICVCRDILAGMEKEQLEKRKETLKEVKAEADRLRAQFRRDIREKGSKECYMDTDTRHAERMFRIGLKNFKMGDSLISKSKESKETAEEIQKHLQNEEKKKKKRKWNAQALEVYPELSVCAKYQDALRMLEFLLEKPHPELDAPANAREVEAYYDEYIIPLRLVIENYYPEEAMETLQDLFSSMISRLTMLKYFLKVRARGCCAPPDNHFLAMDRKLLYLYHLLKVPLGCEKTDYMFLSKLGVKLLFKLRTLDQEDYQYLPDVVGITIRAFTARLRMYEEIKFSCLDHILLPQFILLTSQKYLSDVPRKEIGCPNCFVKPRPIKEKTTSCTCGEMKGKKGILSIKRIREETCPTHSNDKQVTQQEEEHYQNWDSSEDCISVGTESMAGNCSSMEEEDEQDPSEHDSTAGQCSSMEEDEQDPSEHDSTTGQCSSMEEGQRSGILDGEQHSVVPDKEQCNVITIGQQRSVIPEEKQRSGEKKETEESDPERNVFSFFNKLNLCESQRVCDGCGRGGEQVTLEVCGYCEEENLRLAERRYYCGIRCQMTDWKKRHQEEHRHAVPVTIEPVMCGDAHGDIDELD